MDGALRLLPREALVKTSELDQGEWNYGGVLGAISRRRFSMVVDLLPPGQVDALLEIGYGSGLFLPELARHARAVSGVDVHPETGPVTAALAAFGVAATLTVGSMTELPYDDASFDVVVTVSSMEFVDDTEAACTEMVRVLRPGGVAVVVTPGHSRVLDAGLRVLSGERAEETFQGRRQRILPTLRRHFTVERSIALPRLVPAPLRLYTTVQLHART